MLSIYKSSIYKLIYFNFSVFKTQISGFYRQILHFSTVATVILHVVWFETVIPFFKHQNTLLQHFLQLPLVRPGLHHVCPRPFHDRHNKTHGPPAPFATVSCSI